MAKLKNASLKEMLSRMDHWQRDQERFNQRLKLEMEFLKESNEELFLKNN